MILLYLPIHQQAILLQEQKSVLSLPKQALLSWIHEETILPDLKRGKGWLPKHKMPGVPMLGSPVPNHLQLYSVEDPTVLAALKVV